MTRKLGPIVKVNWPWSVHAGPEASRAPSRPSGTIIESERISMSAMSNATCRKRKRVSSHLKQMKPLLDCTLRTSVALHKGLEQCRYFFKS